MKYLGKVIVEIDYELDAPSTDAAVVSIRNQMKVDFAGHKAKLHGVVRADIGWPDTSPSPPTRTPRGRPPSGTPGTPTAPMVDQSEEFVFTRAA